MSDKVYINNVILQRVKCCTWGSSHANCVCLLKTDQISFPLSLSHSLFLSIVCSLTHSLSASVDHVWKYILPSIFYSQEDFLQDIIENNWNKPQQYKVLSDGINRNILLMSWDTAQISETIKDIGSLCMCCSDDLCCSHCNDLSKNKQHGIQICFITGFYLYYTSIYLF